jgi:hemerythrin-like domain-containing protein
MYLPASSLALDDPIDAMLGFHRRIERQLATLGGLPAMLDANGSDAASMTTAASVLDFFSRAMPVHHDDEDELVRVIGFEVHGRLDAEHGDMDRAWRALRRPLQAIAEGVRRTLPGDLVRHFRAGHASHIAFEENALHQVAARALNPADRSALARGMAARRTRQYRFQ